MRTTFLSTAALGLLLHVGSTGCDSAQASPSEEKKLLVEWRTYITDLRAGGSGKVSMGLDELALYWINSRLEKSPIFLQIRQHRVKKRL